MSTPVNATLEIHRNDAGALSAHIKLEFLNSDHEGKEATAQLKLSVKVKDSRPVNDTGVLAQTTFTVRGRAHELRLPLTGNFPYEYEGAQIHHDIFVHLDLGRRSWFRKKLEHLDVVVHPPRKPAASGGEEIVEPEDDFSWIKNLGALSIKDRLATLGLLAIAGVIIGINTLIGIHDQTVPESQTYLYSHYDSDGDSSLPLGKAAGLDALIAAGMWFVIRKRLRRYMTFRLAPLPKRLDKSSTIRVSDLIRGRSRVALHQPTLRIVACNMECGQYTRGSGTNTRTVSFETPIRAMIMFEKTVPLIPGRSPIHTCFEDSLDFEAMFERLYPPCMASDTHGLKLHWEVQLIHPDFVDQELILPTTVFAHEDFFEA
jgi:hypothetical protein